MFWLTLAFYSWSLVFFMLAALFGSETIHVMGLVALTVALLEDGITALSWRLAKEIDFK